MGEMLQATERAKGGQPYQAASTGNVLSPVEEAPTLAELGVTKRESSEAQLLLIHTSIENRHTHPPVDLGRS